MAEYTPVHPVFYRWELIVAILAGIRSAGLGKRRGVCILGAWTCKAKWCW